MDDIALRLVVLLREVCDPRPPARLTADGYGIYDRGLRRIVNPADLSALELALRLAANGRGTVTAVCVGPPRVEEGLRQSLAMGAARAVRVWHSACEGGDAVAGARLLERLLVILTPHLVLTGNRLADRGDDPVPALAAARLGIPCVSAALGVGLSTDGLKVRRKSDRGARQVVTSRLPSVLLCDAECCEPHYPGQAGLMAAAKAPVESWGLAELGLPLWELGAAGALLERDRCSFPRANPQRVVTPDATLPAFERILALLSGGIKPREGKLNTLSAEATVERLLTIFREEGLLDGRRS